MSSSASSLSGGGGGVGDLQLPALRSFDDFTARFQLPNFQDFDKWGNRVVKNLLYYQSNYFLLFICIYLLMLMINPLKIMCGLFVQAFLIAIVLYGFFDLKSSSSSKNFIASRLTRNSSSTTISQQQQHKWYLLAGTLISAYVLLYWFEALLLTSFTLLLPVSITFVHASLRLRNMKNKLVNTMDNIVPTNTPMSAFLDAFNITVDGILN